MGLATSFGPGDQILARPEVRGRALRGDMCVEFTRKGSSLIHAFSVSCRVDEVLEEVLDVSQARQAHHLVSVRQVASDQVGLAESPLLVACAATEIRQQLRRVHGSSGLSYVHRLWSSLCSLRSLCTHGCRAATERRRSYAKERSRAFTASLGGGGEIHVDVHMWGGAHTKSIFCNHTWT